MKIGLKQSLSCTAVIDKLFSQIVFFEHMFGKFMS
jgi:hypothetical protein